MQRKISELDFSNEMDIIYAYKNFSESPAEIIEFLEKSKVTDHGFGTYIFGILEKACLAELKNYTQDAEMNELLEMVFSSKEGKTDEPSVALQPKESNTSQQNASPNNSLITDMNTDNTIDDKSNASIHSPVSYEEALDSDNLASFTCSNIKNLSEIKISNDHSAGISSEKSHPIDTATELSNEIHSQTPIDPKLHINNLNVLLKPIVGICNKQIVNLIYYVYKSTGISHFDFLFDEFKDEAQKIELHLLAAKAIKSMSFDLSDVKEALKVATSTQNNELENSSQMTFGFEKKSFELESQPIIPLPFIENSTEDIPSDPLNLSEAMNFKPFKVNLTIDDHLAVVKKYINDFVFNPSNTAAITTYLIALSHFLEIKFDSEVFQKFIKYHYRNQYQISIIKFRSAPYFFYESIYLYELLGFAPAFKMDPFSDNQLDSPFFSLKPNCHLLNSLIGYGTDFGKHPNHYDINSVKAFTKNLKNFVETYKSPTLFGIFNSLIECNFPYHLNEIKPILLNDIASYLDVFYNQNSVKEAEKVEGWDLHGNNDSSLYKLGGGRGFEDELEKAFLNPSLYQEECDRASYYLLDLYEKENNISSLDRCQIIDNFLIEASSNPTNKIYILKNLETIFNHIKRNELNKKNRQLSMKKEESHCEGSEKDLENSKEPGDLCFKDQTLSACATSSLSIDNSLADDNEIESISNLPLELTNAWPPVFKQIFSNLMVFPDINWRYRKLFVSLSGMLQNIGIPKEWIKETFKNDKVFYIRKMANEL